MDRSLRHSALSDASSNLISFEYCRWVLPKRLPSGRSGRGVRPTAVCVGASTAGGDTGLFSSIHSWGIFNEDLSSQMAPARLHAGIHRRRAAGLNADDDATP
ncbi:g11858 [Coccomyxa elongata]